MHPVYTSSKYLFVQFLTCSCWKFRINADRAGKAFVNILKIHVYNKMGSCTPPVGSALEDIVQYFTAHTTTWIVCFKTTWITHDWLIDWSLLSILTTKHRHVHTWVVRCKDIDYISSKYYKIKTIHQINSRETGWQRNTETSCNDNTEVHVGVSGVRE